MIIERYLVLCLHGVDFLRCDFVSMHECCKELNLVEWLNSTKFLSFILKVSCRKFEHCLRVKEWLMEWRAFHRYPRFGQWTSKMQRFRTVLYYGSRRVSLPDRFFNWTPNMAGLHALRQDFGSGSSTWHQHPIAARINLLYSDQYKNVSLFMKWYLVPWCCAVRDIMLCTKMLCCVCTRWSLRLKKHLLKDADEPQTNVMEEIVCTHILQWP